MPTLVTMYSIHTHATGTCLTLQDWDYTMKCCLEQCLNLMMTQFSTGVLPDGNCNYCIIEFHDLSNYFNSVRIRVSAQSFP